ncbi:hypothetical protein PAXINDRAFT_22183 [Paxillus involutus ATCC 200175]|uniref:Uncharacterized protein n=1 Tax=Paxillus involutus ATCC 200175 TaxID=664439 RepID=A0A0C9TB76_PAXIN|nr:hypothetical protein PAXINDRAFT_22183 [Paxillus involutus ATCC 200175]
MAFTEALGGQQQRVEMEAAIEQQRHHQSEEEARELRQQQELEIENSVPHNFDNPQLPEIEVPELRSSGRPHRATRLPKRYRDVLPEPPIPIAPAVEPDAPAIADTDMDEMSQPHQPSPRTNSDHGSSWIKTDHDTYNIFRQYHGMFPTYDPENSAYFDQFSDSSTFSHVSDDSDRD